MKLILVVLLGLITLNQVLGKKTKKNCVKKPNKLDENVTFWYYDAENRDGKEITSGNRLPFKNDLKFLVHDVNGSKEANTMKAIRNTYIRKQECTVIQPNFSKHVAVPYAQAHQNIGIVSKSVAKFLCALDVHYKLDELHVIGLGLGAHIAGLSAKSLKKDCKKTIMRITGLDPSKTLFENVDQANKLDRSDAKLVDVIHTSRGRYGLDENLGHIDFYPNCGYTQPGCHKRVKCDHQRSAFLFAESIVRNKFKAAANLDMANCTKQDKKDFVFMGEMCKPTYAHQAYYIRTKSQHPFGEGCKGRTPL